MMKIIIPKDKKNRIYLGLGMFLSSLSMFCYLVIPYFVKQIVDREVLIGQTMIFLVLTILSNLLFTYTSSILMSLYSENQIKYLRTKALSLIIRSRTDCFDRIMSGELTGKVINNTEVIKAFLRNSLSEFFSSVLFLILSFLLLFKLDFQLTVLMFIGFLLLVSLLLPITITVGKLSKKKQNSLGKLSGYVTEIFHNIRLIKVNQGYQTIIARYTSKLEEVYGDSVNYNFVDSIVKPSLTLLLIVLISVLFGYGGYRVSVSSISVGTLISFLVYTLQLLSPISSIGQFGSQFQTATENLKELEYYMEMEKEESGDQPLEETIREINFENVSFTRENNKLLSGINLKIEKGEIFAIVGPSGAGKSSLINLLLKVYDDYEGSIFINGIELSKIKTYDLRKKLSVSLQDSNIFADSIYNNITFGLEDEKEEKQIEKVLSDVGFSKLSSEFDSSKNIVVHEGGLNLSGGEKQKIQIARTFLRNGDVFIFDEATSSLDLESEYKILSHIKQHLQDKIIIFITHRVQVINYIDKILFLDNGQITGFGTHRELFKEHERYRNFIEQLSVDKEF